MVSWQRVRLRLEWLQYAGALYHLMSRGNRREKIFVDDVDRQDFIKTLAEACQKDPLAAACLLSDAQSLSPGYRDADRFGHFERSQRQPAPVHAPVFGAGFQPGATGPMSQEKGPETEPSYGLTAFASLMVNANYSSLQ